MSPSSPPVPVVGEPARAVPHVGTYTRILPVSLERLYENALDWEHLPWLHRSSFSHIDCRAAGDWGWRAQVDLALPERGRVELELRLDRTCRRWITRSLEGPGAGSEIWTHAFAVEAQRTDIVVDFFVPDVPPEQRPAVGAVYRELYTRLYDEDVAMMVERQERLDAARGRAAARTPQLVLGDLATLRPRLPLRIDWQGRPFRILELDGVLLAHSSVCPHWLGPLGDAPVRDGGIECPWHGYRFDVRSGRNLSGQRCRLPRAPEVRVEPDGRVVVTAAVA